jgi:protoporphyrinogen oxidase
VIRQPKAYPGYFGAYDRFATVRAYLDGFANLWLVGRNGMHRYNNQDHSMLTAMTAVDQIVAGVRDPEAIWAINTEEEYHEEK